MNKLITLQSFASKTNDGKIILDIASALISEMTDENFMEEILEKLKIPNTILYIPATPTHLGTGDVASNFRYKHDKDINNSVVEKWLQVFAEYNTNKNPVVVTSVGRDARYMTFKLLENGKVNIVNNKDNSLLENETNIFNHFINSYNITFDKMKIIRESTKGARYNTYMADMIGFVNILNFEYNPEMFDKYDLEAQIITPESKFYRSEVEGELMLQPVIKNGKEWKPLEGHNYLYFRNQDKIVKHKNTFYMLNEIHMPIVYQKIFEMLKPEDNVTKSKVREFIKSIMSYDRLSDYWYNDIDDAFTIFMIHNCYRYCELDELDLSIKESFELQINKWLEEINGK
jgi:hypothetical protein